MSSDIIANKYKIVREIARSNDVVYEALDISNGKKIALKELVIPPNLTGQARRERIERFHREARASGTLNHPNIVHVFDYGEDNGRYYIAMEFLEGGTLRDIMQAKGPLSTHQAIDIACQALSALSHAHAHKIVHRDVKPDNMHLINGTQVKLTDFGIARLTEEASLTGEGQVFGTPSYMSPEQIKGKPVDLRSDLFSLSIVLYEMLAGRKPFTGDSVISITYAIMESQPAALSGVPFGIEAVIMRAMNKDPMRRFNSADEMRQELMNAERNPSYVPTYSGGANSGGLNSGYTGGYGAPPTFGQPSAPYGYPSQQPGYGAGTFGGGGYSPMPSNPATPNYNPAAYGQIPSTVYAPPPVFHQGNTGGHMSPPPNMPFVNWAAGNPNNPQMPGPPPPAFPTRKPEPIFSESALRNIRVFFVALILGGVVLGLILLFQKSYDKQQKQAESGVVYAMIRQGQDKLNSQDWDGARQIFEKAYEKGKFLAAGEEARKGIAIAYNHLGLRAYELKDYKTAQEHWFHAYQIDGTNADVVENLKRLSDRMGDKDSAIQEWRSGRNGQSGAVNPAAPGVDPSLDARHEEAQKLYDEGTKAMQKGDIAAARADFQMVVEKATGTPLAADANNILNKLNEMDTSSSPYLR